MNTAYDKCNWKVKILTQTAVSNHEGSGDFFSDNKLANLEVGGTIFGKKPTYYIRSGQKCSVIPLTDRSKVYGTKKEKDNGNLIEYYHYIPQPF